MNFKALSLILIILSSALFGRFPDVIASNGMVVSSNPYASQIGIDILEGGSINNNGFPFSFDLHGQGIIGTYTFNSEGWYHYDCLDQSCLIGECITMETENFDSIVSCMPLILVFGTVG